jgi:hypothetical protein
MDLPCSPGEYALPSSLKLIEAFSVIQEIIIEMSSYMYLPVCGIQAC